MFVRLCNKFNRDVFAVIYKDSKWEIISADKNLFFCTTSFTNPSLFLYKVRGRMMCWIRLKSVGLDLDFQIKIQQWELYRWCKNQTRMCMYRCRWICINCTYVLRIRGDCCNRIDSLFFYCFFQFQTSENNLLINVSAKFSKSTCSCGSQSNSILQDQEKPCPLLFWSRE
jgi:hypothetical protein